MTHCGVVILAAGSSSRLGAPKQLLLFENKPLLQHTLDQVLPLSFASYVLVLGAHADSIRQTIEPDPFEVVVNHNWPEGIASSIRTGLEQSMARCPDLEHLLVLLCDQPFVSTRLMQELMDTHLHSGKKITACHYQDAVGVPAMFSKAFFSELMQLQGDRGANRLIRQYPDDVAVVPFEQGSIDVDTEEDYRRLPG